MVEQRFVFAKFQEQEIFLEQGRLLFSLCHAFATNGYEIHLFKQFPVVALEEYGQSALNLAGVSLMESSPNDTKEYIYIFDKEDDALAQRPWRKKIKIAFDLFSPYWFESPIIMPFPVHPVHSMRDFTGRLEYFRSIEKNKKIFFSGDIKDYRRNRVRYPKPKLPRLEIVNTIREGMGGDVLMVGELSALDQLDQAGYVNKCVMVDTSRIWVDDKKWPDMLAGADFFLAPPGIVMPMCHNIIEAMAVGCVPITNYPEWFDPALTHMKNCISFDNKNDLLDKLRLALSMSPEDISEMRAHALEYYEKYLCPSTFIRRIEEATSPRLTMLMITEKNMAQRSTKLGKYSVLIKGTAGRKEATGMQRLLSVLLD